jgi:hypothetical protein
VLTRAAERRAGDRNRAAKAGPGYQPWRQKTRLGQRPVPVRGPRAPRCVRHPRGPHRWCWRVDRPGRLYWQP